jgi:hypothetical protein
VSVPRARPGQDRKKPILFTMARLDRVKNLTGLVEWYGANERLRGLVNLVVVGGIVDPANSNDREEKDQCIKMHEILKQFKLEGQVRGHRRVGARPWRSFNPAHLLLFGPAPCVNCISGASIAA